MGRIRPGVAFIAFQFPSFRHKVKAITRESRTLPEIYLDLDLDLDKIGDQGTEISEVLARSRLDLDLYQES